MQRTVSWVDRQVKAAITATTAKFGLIVCNGQPPDPENDPHSNNDFVQVRELEKYVRVIDLYEDEQEAYANGR